MAALTATVLLWSSFALSTRGIGETSLTTIDAAFIRFAIPLIVLAPWVPATITAVRQERLPIVALVLAGGLPHFLLFALGARLTSAGLTGLLVPGTVPLFVTGLLFLRYRQRIAGRKLAALSAIVAGIVAIAVLTGGGASLLGIVVLLTAGLVWAVYTLGLQHTTLDLKAVIVLVSAGSAAAAALLAVTGVMPSHLLTGTVQLPHLLTFAALQGVGTGLLSTAFYALAVRRLGSSTAAVAGALSPVLTAVIAVPLFGEPITTSLAIGLAFIVTGVIGFNLPSRRALQNSTHSITTAGP